MMDQISTLGDIQPAAPPPAPAATLTGEWRSYRRFLQRPDVPGRAMGPSWRTLLATARLLLLDYLIMGLLLALGFLAYVSGVDFPENALESVAFTGGMVALIVVGAPVMEEVMFRAWLSGRRWHVLAVLVLLALGALATLLGDTPAVDQGGNTVLLSLLALVAAATVASWLGHFPKVFPVFFWLSALAFATIHIWNYTEGQNWIVFLLVLPQLIAGTIFGYARVRYGLWSAVLLHALHNGTALTLAILTEGMMG